MEVFRLSREKFANTLSGAGAAMRGARWNSTGVELIYTTANRSLAMAEVAVHFSLATLPADFQMITMEVPDDIQIQQYEQLDLPINWQAFPHPASTQAIGVRFIRENKYCLLRMPSVVTRGDFNVLINPFHTDFHRIRIIRIESFPFDKRIFR